MSGAPQAKRIGGWAVAASTASLLNFSIHASVRDLRLGHENEGYALSGLLQLGHHPARVYVLSYALLPLHSRLAANWKTHGAGTETAGCA